MGIPYMTNKTKTKRNTNKRRVKQAKPTPFQDVGGIIGSAVGNLFGFKQAKGIGKWLGTGIGSIFGSGDYQMVGQPPNYNVLTNDRQIPKFESTDRTNVVCHREYIKDVVSTQAFSNDSYRINPGDSKTFPWLSSLADQYQQYRIHGMIFEFRPLTTDYAGSGQPGVLVMATNYNAEDLPFGSKVEMENSEFAVSVKPTLAMIHAIECDPRETTITKLYVDKSNSKDPRFSDLGTFQVATLGHASAGVILGELWVSYCVEFYKPKLSTEVGGVLSAEVFRGVTSSTNPYGTVGISNRGDIDVNTTGTSIQFTSSPNQKWLLTMVWIGDVAAASEIYVQPGLVGAVYEDSLLGNTRNCYFSPEVSVSCKQLTLTMTIKSSTAGGVITVEKPIFSALPSTNTYCSILITRVDDSI